MVGQVLRSLIQYRVLAWEMAKHELRGVLQGSVFGILWLVIRPLIQASAYIFLVGFVLQSKPTAGSTRIDYVIYVLTGLVGWEYMTKSLAETPTLIRSRMAIVSQVMYPIETLPLASLLIGAVGPSVTLLLVLVLGVYGGSLAWTTIFLVVPLILLIAFLMGAGWIFMFLGVLLKDLSEVIGLMLGLMVYFSPVVLTEGMVGPTLWRWVQINPLSHVVISMRDVFYGTFSPISWLVFCIMSVTTFCLGAWTVSHAKVKINEFL